MHANSHSDDGAWLRRTRHVGLGLLLAALVSACDLESELQPDPESVPTSDVLDLTRTGGDLPLIANGNSADTLVAKIPRGASDRVVTFTTNRGSFLTSAGVQTVKVRAEQTDDRNDKRLVARVVLFSDTVATSGVVSATVGAYTDYLVVPFVK